MKKWDTRFFLLLLRRRSFAFLSLFPFFSLFWFLLLPYTHTFSSTSSTLFVSRSLVLILQIDIQISIFFIKKIHVCIQWILLLLLFLFSSSAVILRFLRHVYVWQISFSFLSYRKK
jgi:hypothetical protein